MLADWSANKHSVAILRSRYVGEGSAYMTWPYGLRDTFGDIIAITADDTEDAQEGRDYFAAQAEHRRPQGPACRPSRPGAHSRRLWRHAL